MGRSPVSCMRVAGLCDIHGNRPALQAVLAEAEQDGAEAFVIGGDAISGPLPRETAEQLIALDRLREILGGIDHRVVVGGHTHQQFDRFVGGWQFVNAGSVGMPYEGRRGAYWAMLGPDVELRRTEYDVDQALIQLRARGFPDLEEMLKESLIDPMDPAEIAEYFENQASR